MRRRSVSAAPASAPNEMPPTGGRAADPGGAVGAGPRATRQRAVARQDRGEAGIPRATVGYVLTVAKPPAAPTAPERASEHVAWRVPGDLDPGGGASAATAPVGRRRLSPPNRAVGPRSSTRGGASLCSFRQCCGGGSSGQSRQARFGLRTDCHRGRRRQIGGPSSGGR